MVNLSANNQILDAVYDDLMVTFECTRIRSVFGLVYHVERYFMLWPKFQMFFRLFRQAFS